MPALRSSEARGRRGSHSCSQSELGVLVSTVMRTAFHPDVRKICISPRCVLSRHLNQVRCFCDPGAERSEVRLSVSEFFRPRTVHPVYPLAHILYWPNTRTALTPYLLLTGPWVTFNQVQPCLLERERFIGTGRVKRRTCAGVGRREPRDLHPLHLRQGTLCRCPGINLRCAAVDGPAPRPPRVHLGVVGPVSGPLFARGIILHGRTRANRCKV